MSQFFKTYEETDEWLMKWRGLDDFTINNDLSVDVDGSVNISQSGLSHIPVQFNKIKGNFDCSKNDLTSLEGAPRSVEGNFDCSYNRLASLEGAPTYVEENFYCQGNPLRDVSAARISIGCGDYEGTTVKEAQENKATYEREMLRATVTYEREMLRDTSTASVVQPPSVRPVRSL